MVMPIDAKRGRFMKADEKKRAAEAEEFRMREFAKPSSRDRPAWMEDKNALPRKPPTRSGKPYEAR